MDELNGLVAWSETGSFGEVQRIDALVETQAPGQLDVGKVLLIERLTSSGWASAMLSGEATPLVMANNFDPP